MVDSHSGRILDSGEGHGSEALTEFWERVKREHVEIKCVGVDLSSPSLESVRENAPNAINILEYFESLKDSE